MDGIQTKDLDNIEIARLIIGKPLWGYTQVASGNNDISSRPQMLHPPKHFLLPLLHQHRDQEGAKRKTRRDVQETNSNGAIPWLPTSQKFRKFLMTVTNCNLRSGSKVCAKQSEIDL